MAQQIISSDYGAASYGSENVAAGAVQTICDFTAPGAGVIAGMSIGFGLSDVTAWGGGGKFYIYLDGLLKMEFVDQISTLLQPEFLPMHIRHGQRVQVIFENGTAAAIDVAVFARVDVVQ